MRDYGVDGQIGLEPTLEEYHARLLKVTAECMRVLKPTGVMFWNHGDSYGGSASQGFGGKGGTYAEMAPHGRKRPKITDKCLIMQNERLITRMIDDQGWILRNRIIWSKSNAMPSSVTDRFSNKYEPVYMLTKQRSYWFDLDAVRKPYTEPMNRWGGQKLKAIGKSDWDNGTGQESYRDRDMRPNPLGKNPGDVWDLKSPEDDWKQLLEVMSGTVGVEAAISMFESYMQSRNVPPDVWTIPTQPYTEAHFATFPTSLVEPMIKAACPAEICPVCGLARTRITERDELPPPDVFTTTNAPNDGLVASGRRNGAGFGQKYQDWLNEHPMKTIGWTSCDCNAGWIAGTVLDPFAGSGTVGEVARNLNRNAILLELNPEYGGLIAKRTMANTPPLTAYIGDD